jgi:hypothetical protein
MKRRVKPGNFGELKSQKSARENEKEKVINKNKDKRNEKKKEES